MKNQSKIKMLKGIDTTSAMTVHVEIADFTRFPTAKAFMAYVGLTPSESSRGRKSVEVRLQSKVIRPLGLLL
ncbi:IS110 family transposase [Bacillus thuringiensis]|uniref:IS110 family transposase n=1 Tax=Bacillus thuringiensis TaxID=1428 RepID=UPI001E5F6341|nr:IS110 family transposase [Bacillus thuringiensis]